jgi:hypothetical protein
MNQAANDICPNPGSLEHAILQEHEAAEAFYIQTEQIAYVAVLYTDENWHCYGNGYALFANGEKVRFTLDGNNDPNVRDKCIRVSRQLARMYEGTLHQGIIDAQGTFWPQEDSSEEAQPTERAQ